MPTAASRRRHNGSRDLHTRARKFGAGPQDHGICTDTVFDGTLGHLCWICGQEVKRSEASIDHVIPLRDGGTNTWNNVALAHKSCNNLRDKFTVRPRMKPVRPTYPIDA